jgi:tetratricopeptide (TPR) repeat protein
LTGSYYAYRGEFEKARDAWQKAVLHDEEAFEARFRLMEAEESLGTSPDPLSSYSWFVDRYENGGPLSPSDLEWVGRAYVKLEKYEWDGAQKAYQEALDATEDLEPVLIAKGDLWLDRYDEQAAIQIYGSILQKNNESLPAYVGVARANLEMGNLSGAKKAVDQALFLNPGHPEARAMNADILFYDELGAEAEESLERGYRSDPNSVPLAAIETAYAIRRKEWEKVDRIRARIETVYTRPWEYFFRLAKCLERNYLFEEAERRHLEALETAPSGKQSVAAVAMLRSRISPASAETALEPMREAFKQDPYHLRLHNMRNLFAGREEFARLESERFLVRMPEEAARVYGEVALAALDEHYADLLAKNPYRPSGKTLVEFYENPSDFSMRISGLPGAGLSGVCFGDIVILQAPRKGSGGDLNWGNVLRHELTHVFSLGLSDHRIPRWYTEGLSVAEEWDPGLQNDPILLMRLKSNDLIPVEEMDRSFHRPAGPQTVWAAYAVAGDAVRYLTDRFGYSIHLELLKGFSTGRWTHEVTPEVTGLDFEEFNAGVRSRIADRLGYKGGRDAVSGQVEDASEDALPPREKAMRLVAHLSRSGNWAEALTEAEGWLGSHPDDVSFLERKAKAHYELGEQREARKTAEKILEATSESVAAHLVLAGLDQEYRRWDSAIDHYLAAHKVRPRNIGPGSPIREAEKILRDEKDWGGLAEALAMRLDGSPTDAEAYRELVRIALEGDKTALAEKAVRQALYLEPFALETQILWGKILLSKGEPGKATKRFEIAQELAPLSGQPKLALAQALLASGSREGAVEQARAALDLDPTLEEARDIALGLPTGFP